MYNEISGAGTKKKIRIKNAEQYTIAAKTEEKQGKNTYLVHKMEGKIYNHIQAKEYI